MSRRSTFLFASLLLLICCSDPDVRVVSLREYSPTLMFYQAFVPRLPEENVFLDYKNKKVVRRTGGLLTMFGAGGYSTGIFPEIYDTVKYFDDRIEVSQLDQFDGFDLTYPYTYTGYTNPDGTIRLIVRPQILSSEVTILDSTTFVYNTAGQVESTMLKSWRPDFTPPIFRFQEVKTFSYEKGNVVKIEGVRTTRQGVVTTSVESFENYDNAPNPVAGLQIFQELFPRSLSKNNFTKYSIERKRSDGSIIESKTLEWTLSYDGSGVPTFH